MQEIITVLSDPTRRAVLAVLWGRGEPGGCELVLRLDAGQSQMSMHMKTLREVGLVLDRRDAEWVRYRCKPDLAPELAAMVDSVLAEDRSTQEGAS